MRSQRSSSALGSPSSSSPGGRRLRHDRPDALEALACGRGGDVERIFPPCSVRCPGRHVDREHERREVLTDLVVELEREPATLGVLGGLGAAGAVPALLLEPVEHLVEGLLQVRDLDALRLHRKALPGPQRVDRAHDAPEAPERPEDPPHRQEVRDEHRGDHPRQHRGFADRRGPGHRERRGGEQDQRNDQDRGVRPEEQPEQGAARGAAGQPPRSRRRLRRGDRHLRSPWARRPGEPGCDRPAPRRLRVSRR